MNHKRYDMREQICVLTGLLAAGVVAGLFWVHAGIWILGQENVRHGNWVQHEDGWVAIVLFLPMAIVGALAWVGISHALLWLTGFFARQS